MAAIDASVYDEIIIESNDGANSVDIRFGVTSIDYYEDVLSPTITVKIQVMNTGDAVVTKGGKVQSIYNGLPLRGGERVAMKIAKNSETNSGLDFATSPKDYLYISSITDVIHEPQREVFTIHLVSREAITNETTRVSRKYPTNQAISISAEKIIQEYLKPDKDIDIDTTTNDYGFIGNLRKPFTVLTWLASKAVPDITDGTAGFFFYQTQSGFKFKSIDKLISQSPFPKSYVYTGANNSGVLENNDFKILRYSTNKNQNLLEKLRLGAYSSYRVGFNPLTVGFSEGKNQNQAPFVFNQYKNKTKNLGQEIKLPPISNDANIGLGDIPTRIISQVFDIGTVDKGVSLKPNADLFKYQSQSIMRYNLLFTQQLSMTIPLNTNLKAGDIITCKFPQNTRDKSKTYDEEQSGLYMIKELCHHFDPDQSLTSMKLVRDTFGLYGTNDQ